MTKKILVFGCSFSRGSYTIGGEKNKWTLSDVPDTLENSRGWFYYVDYFKDKDVTICDMSGQGYWGW